MSDDDRAGGASAARHKLAAFLRERGLTIPFGSPPEDEDFWYAIQEFAERYGADLPRFGEESVASRNLRESLEAYKAQQDLRATESRISEPQLQANSRKRICRHCREPFVPKRGKPGYIDECSECVHTRSYPGQVQSVGVNHNISEEKLEAVIQKFQESYKPKGPKVFVSRSALHALLELFARKFKNRT